MSHQLVQLFEQLFGLLTLPAARVVADGLLVDGQLGADAAQRPSSLAQRDTCLQVAVRAGWYQGAAAQDRHQRARASSSAISPGGKQTPGLES